MNGSKHGWRGNFCLEVSPTANTVVIFGASGDLARRKLIPALFSLWEKELFHERSVIIGCARTPFSDDQYRAEVEKLLLEKWKSAAPSRVREFLKKIYYVPGQYGEDSLYADLSAKVKDVECGECVGSGRVFYLAVPPDISGTIVKKLGASGLTSENYDGVPWRNVIIEKPFGRDLSSAEALDRELRETLDERQIYRIDHYLGKDTVQNILMMRFANSIFEPLWNNSRVDRVEITVAESLGVENRAGYFEHAGLLRDMFQNHILQMLALVAMEPPLSFAADHVREERKKLLRAIRPFPVDKLDEFIVRGQYEEGVVGGKPVPGYRAEHGVPPDSATETYVAAKILIDNWRWSGVPFYIRSGKRLERKLSEVAIFFKRIPHSIFSPIRPEDMPQNALLLNIQPEEGFGIKISAKEPGPKLCMGSLSMDFKYSEIMEGEPPDAYERLLLDCMLNDQTLFLRSDSIEVSWALLTPVLEEWERRGAKSLFKYRAGSWGPSEADKLIQKDGFFWRDHSA